MKEKALEEWINHFERKKRKKEIQNNIKMLKSMQKEILSKTNMFIAEKSVVELVFEKYINELKGKL